MFTTMIEEIKNGVLPEKNSLRGRFHAAITKKLALVQQPPTYWEIDPKRNPRADHLLFAALLLEDRDLVDVVLGIIAIEAENNKNISARQYTEQAIDAFVALARDDTMRNLLQQKISISPL